MYVHTFSSCISIEYSTMGDAVIHCLWVISLLSAYSLCTSRKCTMRSMPQAASTNCRTSFQSVRCVRRRAPSQVCLFGCLTTDCIPGRWQATRRHDILCCSWGYMMSYPLTMLPKREKRVFRYVSVLCLKRAEHQSCPQTVARCLGLQK